MATVSLPSIHEMFPAHLICRDEFVPRSRARPPPPPSSLSSTYSGPSSSTAGPSHVRMPHLPTYPPAHPHAHGVAHSAHTLTSRAYGSSSGHAPISAANTSSRRSSFAGAQLHPHAHAHAGTTAPGAPSERRPPHVHHPYSHPHDERQRRHSYQQYPPPSTHQHQHQHHPMDTSDGEEDASEGSIGGSPIPANAQIPSMPIHTQGYSAAPHHAVHPQGHPGMSVMPMPPPINEGDGVPSGKKHVCPTCFKRFNRPSSLRIHVNTHTGATPFRCPWPNCGREFNVNSNMRRHYRNHTTGTSSSSSNPPPSSVSHPNPNPNPNPNTRLGSSNITNHPAIPPALRGGLHGGPAPPPVGRSAPPTPTSSMSMPPHAAPSDDTRKDQRLESWHAHNPNQFQRGYAAYRLGRERQGRQHREGEDVGDPDEEVDELAEDSEHEDTRSRMDVDVDDGRRDSQRSRHTPAPRERAEYPRPRPDSNSNAPHPSSRPQSTRTTTSPSLSLPSSSSPSLSPALSAFGGPSSESQSSRSSESQSSRSSASHSSEESRSPTSSSSSRSPISSSSSSSPLDAKLGPRYSPSTPYSRSVADTRVSTVLRPAFG